MDNQTRRILLERVKASGFPGSILDVFQNPAILDEYVAQQQQQLIVAQTPQEQEQGLRPAHAAGNVGQSMIFPNVQPNQSFNTVGMKIPINIDKVDDQGNLVESYKAVPPGIQNLPTGPNRGMVIESPAEGYQKGGFHQKIYTDPEEFRIANKAYNDSLDVYNLGEYNWKQAKNYGIVTDEGIVYISDDEVENIPQKKINTHLQPISKRYTTSDYYSKGYGSTNKEFPIYKKPTEEPVYQERPKGEYIKSKDGRFETSKLMPIRPTLMPPSNTMRVLKAIQEEDKSNKYMYPPRIVAAPEFKTGGVNKHQTGDFRTPPANLPWLGAKGQVLTEEEQEEKLLDKKFGTGPTVDKAQVIKDRELLKRTKSIERPLPSGAITPTMGPVEFALMVPVAGASALRAAPIIGSALNTSIAGVQGLTVGNALGAGFASDAIVNRFPQIPGQINRGEYTNAATNAVTGLLDVGSAGMFSSLSKATRGIKSTYNPSEDDIIRGLLKNAERDEIERMGRIKPVNISLSQYPYLKSPPNLSKRDQLDLDSFTRNKWSHPELFWKRYNMREHGVDYDRPITIFNDPSIPPKEKKQMGGSYETVGTKTYLKGGLKNRVLYNKAKYKR